MEENAILVFAMLSSLATVAVGIAMAVNNVSAAIALPVTGYMILSTIIAWKAVP